MDYFYQFLISSLSSYILEISSGIAGLYYLNLNPNTSKSNKYLVYFLWVTVFVEIIGIYAPLAYFTEYRYFEFVKGTVFKDNYWWYNIHLLLSFIFFTYYFSSFLKKNSRIKILKLLNILFLFSGLINLFFSDVFFNGYSIYTQVIGTLLVLFSIILFYFDLLKSDQIISLKKLLPIYISIGVLVFILIGTPLDIYSEYFTPNNDLYVKLKGFMLVAINFFMYSFFIIGFLVCARKKTK